MSTFLVSTLHISLHFMLLQPIRSVTIILLCLFMIKGTEPQRGELIFTFLQSEIDLPEFKNYLLLYYASSSFMQIADV